MYSISDLIEIFRLGGIWMIFILVIGVFSLAIFIERLFVLYFKASVDKEKFMAQIQRAILSGDLNSAVNYCNDRSAPLNNIVKAGIVSVMNKGKDEEVQTAMDVAALREIPTVERGTPFLALFGNLATLIGLLATIVGLIKSFRSLAGVDPAQKQALLASGIAEAMNGTAFGLIVAIPSLLAYAILNAKTQRILDDVHESSVSTLNLILQNREKFNR